MNYQGWRLKNLLGAASLGASLLGLVLVTGGVVNAQDARDEAKPPQAQEEAKPQQEPKPAEPKANEARPPRQQEQAKPEENKQQKDVMNQDEKRNDKNEKQNEMKSEKDQNKSTTERNTGQNMHAAGQKGGHIPDDKFHGNFGRQHTFKVQRTEVVEGRPRFQYGGYQFALVDAWPVGWAYTDDCYVDYIDGEYVLVDLLHPEVHVALIVVM